MSALEREIRDNVYAIVTAFNYNMDSRELYECLKQALDRLNGNPFTPHQNIAIDLIVSFIVLRYGDYGTSPRYGRFPTFERKIICDEIASCMCTLEDEIRQEGEHD